jgi:hypothetical protein
MNKDPNKIFDRSSFLHLVQWQVMPPLKKVYCMLDFILDYTKKRNLMLYLHFAPSFSVHLKPPVALLEWQQLSKSVSQSLPQSHSSPSSTIPLPQYGNSLSVEIYWSLQLQTLYRLQFISYIIVWWLSSYCIIWLNINLVISRLKYD